MKFLPLLLVLCLMSCSSRSENKHLIWEEWKGQSTELLAQHPYFKNLPLKKVKHKDGLETWVFQDQTKFQTGAYCQSLGGCMGMPIYNCNNAFSVQAGKILGFERSGSCPNDSTVEVPDLNKN